jgi:hypothetical protein
MKQLSYRDFKRRQRQAEADYRVAVKAFQDDLYYVKSKGVDQVLLDEARGLLAPPGSFLARILRSSKHEQRFGSSMLRWLRGRTKHTTYDSLTQGQGGIGLPGPGDNTGSRMERIFDAGLAIVKPILWTVALGLIKGYLTRKSKLFRFFSR